MRKGVDKVFNPCYTMHVDGVKPKHHNEQPRRGQKGSKKMNVNETVKTEKMSKSESKRLAGNAVIRYRNACIDYFKALQRGKSETDIAAILTFLSETYFTMLDMNEIRYHVPEEIVRMSCAKIKVTKETGAIHIDMKNVPSIVRAAMASDVFVDAKYMTEKAKPDRKSREKTEKIQFGPEIEAKRNEYNICKRIAKGQFELAEMKKSLDAPAGKFEFPSLPEWYAQNVAA